MELATLSARTSILAAAARYDIAEANLTCALGLPGSTPIDVQECLRWVDAAAQLVARQIREQRHLFDRNPGEFDRSEAVFKAAMLVKVFVVDLRVGYGLDAMLMEDEEFFRDRDNLFIHGIIKGKGGTCSSLPPLYIAVGRRLGYPLKMVTCVSHLFARWDDMKGERFNIECTRPELVMHPDEHYRHWPIETTWHQVNRGGFLKSLFPRQEVSQFLSQCGRFWMAHERYAEAVEAYRKACLAAPERICCRLGLKEATAQLLKRS